MLGGKGVYTNRVGKKKKKKHCSHFLKVALGSYKLHKVAPVPVVVMPKLSEVTDIK